MTDTPGTNESLKSSQASLTWDENGLPVSSQFDDVYFSRTSGLEETRYVFLQHNQLPQRFADLEKGQTFTIGETGFGTGLNFLCAWQSWNSESRTDTSRLHFLSVEKYPLTREQLRQALSLWPELERYSEQLIEQYPPPGARGIHRLIFDGGEVTLSLFFGDAVEGFEQWCQSPWLTGALANGRCHLGARQTGVDAWFLDGFAPAKNPDMWQPALFHTLARLSHNQTTFATFTCAGAVRRALAEAGFQWRKVPGFGSKREMLTGRYPADDTRTGKLTGHDSITDNAEQSDGNTNTRYRKKNSVQHAWHLQDNPVARPGQVLVVGAGLAGCHIARALAQRGIRVTVIDRAPQPASGASGNPQGLVYTRLSPSDDALSRFNRLAQYFADRFYQIHGTYRECGEQCGVLHLAMDERQADYFQQLATSDCGWLWLTAAQASEAAGVRCQMPGLLLPDSGWLNPAKLCSRLLDHPLISCRYQTELNQLRKADEKSGTPGWLAQCRETQSGDLILAADSVVLATANDARNLKETGYLTTRPVRGQVSVLPATAHSRKLKLALCGNGYIAPATGDGHCAGATFAPRMASTELLEQDHLQNLDKLLSMSPDLRWPELQAQPGAVSGRVAFRCTTPDYFPIVGPVPETEAFCEHFADYRRRGNARFDQPGPYQTGLFLSVGYGSRGLAYAPLASEMLADMMCGDILPLPRELMLHLHPARFLFRELVRGQR